MVGRAESCILIGVANSETVGEALQLVRADTGERVV